MFNVFFSKFHVQKEEKDLVANGRFRSDQPNAGAYHF